jgi:xylose isomerase
MRFLDILFSYGGRRIRHLFLKLRTAWKNCTFNETNAGSKRRKATVGLTFFSNPRYMNGASTNPDLANAAVQVKNAIDATTALGERITFSGEAVKDT